MTTYVCIGPCGLEKPITEFTTFKGRRHGYKRCHACRAEMALERANAEAQGRDLKQERLRDQAVDAAIKAIEKQAARLLHLKGEQYAATLLRVTADSLSTLGR